MRRSVLAARLGVVLLLLAGCSRFALRIEPDPSADMTRLRTWAWLPPEFCDQADQRLPDRYIDQRLRDAAERVLRARGYEPAAGTAPPDFWLNFRLTSDTESQLYMPRGYGLSPWWRYDRAGVDSYEEGTLIFDAVAVQTRSLVWRGSASARLLPHISLEKRAQRVDDVVQQVLGQFPARPGASPSS